MIDEFGFEKIERDECPQAAGLFYKIIDARSGQRSTALATNIDFDAWSDYLERPSLGHGLSRPRRGRAILLKIQGKSYRTQKLSFRQANSARKSPLTMPFIDYQAVRSRTGMEQVLEGIGFQPTTRQGPKLRGPCPLPHCSSQSPRTFSVHLAKKLYHCFACQNHGNQLDLWAAVHQLTIYQAAVDLCQKANIPTPNTPPKTKPQPLPAPQSSHPATNPTVPNNRESGSHPNRDQRSEMTNGENLRQINPPDFGV